MAKREVIELEGCTDCVLFLANGDLPEDGSEWKPEDIELRWQGYDLMVAGNEDSEEYFSWRACEVCGSHLGGNRYPCAALKCEAVDDEVEDYEDRLNHDHSMNG